MDAHVPHMPRFRLLVAAAVAVIAGVLHAPAVGGAPDNPNHVGSVAVPRCPSTSHKCAGHACTCDPNFEKVTHHHGSSTCHSCAWVEASQSHIISIKWRSICIQDVFWCWAKTRRLESSIKKFKPHFIYACIFFGRGHQERPPTPPRGHQHRQALTLTLALALALTLTLALALALTLTLTLWQATNTVKHCPSTSGKCTVKKDCLCDTDTGSRKVEHKRSSGDVCYSCTNKKHEHLNTSDAVANVANVADTPRCGDCCRMMKEYNVLPGVSWGTLALDLQSLWGKLDCDKVLRVSMHSACRTSGATHRV